MHYSRNHRNDCKSETRTYADALVCEKGLTVGGKILSIEYRKATPDEAQIICDIVRGTKAEIYPHYYTQAVVDFFGRLHSIENNTRDVADGKVDVLIAAGEIVGTGSRDENHITRVYVLPEYEGRDYGSIIMDHLEADIYRRLGYREFDTKQIDEELKLVYLEKQRQ